MRSQAQRPDSGVRLVVGRTVHVSTARSGDTHYEVHAAADPRNPANLVVGSIVYPADSRGFATAVYTSTDGGRSWMPTLDGTGLENTGDPAVAYGPDGSAYYTASHIPPSGGDRSMLFFRSRNGGATWSDSSSLTYTDRQYVTADATGGRYNGRIYVNGNNRVPRNVSDFVLFSSADSGRTFTGPTTRKGFGTFTAQSMGNAVVMSDGTLIGVFSETHEGRNVLSATTSTDGGATLSPAVTISDSSAAGIARARITTSIRCRCSPSMLRPGSSGTACTWFGPTAATVAARFFLRYRPTAERAGRTRVPSTTIR